MDIKKAWNQLKKDLKLEGIDLTGRCYLTAKQLQNRTATMLIVNSIPYEKEISESIDSLKDVLNSDCSDCEKVENAKYYTKQTGTIAANMAKYGTKENEYNKVVKSILNSNAWNRFVSIVGNGNVTTCKEQKDIFLYLRINY